MSDKWPTAVGLVPCRGPRDEGRNYFKDTSATRCRKLKRNDGRAKSRVLASLFRETGRLASSLTPSLSHLSHSLLPLCSLLPAAEALGFSASLAGRSGKGQTRVRQQGTPRLTVGPRDSRKIDERLDPKRLMLLFVRTVLGKRLRA